MLRRLLPAFLGLVVPAALAAQLPRATGRSVGMVHSATAAARGYEAIAWNPALLGMPDRPSFSLNVIQATAGSWSNAFDAGDVLKYEGDTLTTADKDTILAKIPDGSPMTLGLGVDATGIALTVRNFGFMIAGRGAAEGRVSRDFAELILYGNLQRRAVGNPPFTADSSAAAGWAGGTVAASFALPIGVPTGHLAVGATVKVTQGAIIAGVQDLGSMLQTNPFVGEARAHLLYTHPDSSLWNGFGVGADLGVAYDLISGVRLGLAIENAVSSMSWDEDALLYQRREYRLEQQGDVYADSVISEIEETPFDETDPIQAALRDSLVGRSTFPTRVRAGAMLRVGPVLLAGDAMVRLKRGLVSEESRRVSAAAELPLSVVALRGGLATDLETGVTFGGGLGVKGGPLRVDLAASWTPAGDRQGLFLALGVGIMN